MDKYTIDVLDYSSKLDAMVSGCGEISKLAALIIEHQSPDAALSLLKKMSEIADSKEYAIEIKKIVAMLKDGLIRYYGHMRILEICNPINEKQKDEKSLSELLDELNSLIGLEKVKEKVNDLIIYQRVQKMRQENNLHTVKRTLHLAFMGNPGTGKITVARIIGRIYKQIGLLSRGHFVEVSRTDLIAGYQGQTALKVKKIIDQARGGVLFIDEAYSITENEHSDSYGRECLTELTKALEDYRDDLVVIVAGYTEPMNKFFDSNPGLKSRFNTFIEFEDYSAKELWCILDSMCSENDYVINESAKKEIDKYLTEIVQSKSDNFANGRMVRNLYDDLVMNHARRVIHENCPGNSILSTIIKEDFCTLSKYHNAHKIN